MAHTWLVLLPPLVVLATVFIVRSLIPAFIIGLLSAAYIASDFSIFDSLNLLLKRIACGISDLDTLYNFSFLFAIGVFVVLLNATGGAASFARTLTKHLKTAWMAEGAILPLSLILALDDYLNTLTVAHVMRPLTDQFHIPRAKLAFLVHSMAGPLVMLIPVSSWAAMIVGQLDLSGISLHPNAKIIGDPFYAYVQSIPFIFYSLLMIVVVWIIVKWRISFGPMAHHEEIAKKTHNLFGGKPPLAQLSEQETVVTGTISDLLVPLTTLLGCVMIGIAWAGGYYLFGGTQTLFEAFKNNNQTSLVLFVSSIITLIIGFTQALLKKRINPKQIISITFNGIELMYAAILVVFLASTLGTILRIDLNTGSYLAELLLGSISPFFLPLMLFVTSTLVSLAIGSAWGTISLMLPIAIPMFLTFMNITTPTDISAIPLLFPCLGAVFAGAVVGDHISPTSGAAIMASTSSGAYHLDHIITQLPYTIPVFVGCIAAFLTAGYCSNTTLALSSILSFGAGLSVCLLCMYLLNQKNKGGQNFVD